jgi:hypothetical protein
MLVLRNRRKGVRFAPFCLGLCVFALIPTETGHQDIASLLARQPGVAERWQERVLIPASNAIQVATFGFVRPIGTSLPRTATMLLASLEQQGDDIVGAVTRNPLMRRPNIYQASDFPKVDRTLKGDRLAIFSPEAPEAAEPVDDPSTSNASVHGAKTANGSTDTSPLDPELADALNEPPLPQYDISMSLEAKPLDDLKSATENSDVAIEPASSRDGFSMKTASLYFGASSLGSAGQTMQRWQPGEEPMLVLPGGADPDMEATASLPADPAVAAKPAETVASKGQVNIDNRPHVKTPAERLGLDDNSKSRAKQEKCLANAVYFEARGEPVRGQIAVAQVVMNRVFSGFYPTTVCGVVYQNANRHLACQFTFACDGIRDVVREPEMWVRAKKIAKATLDGKLWLPEVAKSTHYHAYCVHPSWVHDMKKM